MQIAISQLANPFLCPEKLLFILKNFFAFFEWTNEYAIKLVTTRGYGKLPVKRQNRRPGK